MTKLPSLIRIVAVLLVAAFAGTSQAWIRSPAIAFAELPPGTGYPEGITVDGRGNLYVANFDIANGGPGNIVVFDPSGKVIRKLVVPGTSNLLLGIAFHPQTGDLLVCDLGKSMVWKVDPLGGSASPFATLPPGSGPNALAFDAQGNVYISDSFGGAIYRTGATGSSTPDTWVADALLGTSGVPPFGANGMAFNKAGTALFVANTGNDTVVKVPVGAGGVAGKPSVFINSINGADGIARDDDDNLWVAANQSDEIVVVNPDARVIAKLGDFDGIDPRGAPRGLLFPASLVFSKGFVYVTNLALDLRNFKLDPTTNSLWSADVKRFTVSRIRAQIPPIQGP